jgi:hypothetical protein
MLALAGPVGAIAAGAMMAASAIKDLTLKMIDMAAAAAPGQYELFNQALNDTQAVIGRVFVPVLELATDAVRGFADFMTNILPTTDQVREAFEPLREALDEVKAVMMEMAPFIRDVFAASLKALAVSIKVVVDQFRLALKTFDAMTFGFFRAYNQFAEPANKSSMGAAAGPARYMEVEDLGRQAALASFKLGTAGEKSQKRPEERTADGIDRIVDFFVDDIIPAVQELRRKAGKAGDFVKGAAQGVESVLDPMGLWRGLLGWNG